MQVQQSNLDQIHTLFFSKSLDLHTCEQKYYWRYHKWLVPKQKNPNLLRGGFIHNAVHHAHVAGLEQEDLSREAKLGIGLVRAGDEIQLPDSVAVEANAMTLTLWDKLQSFTIKESEAKLEVSLPGGFKWKAKLDAILQQPDGLWQGEYKSSARYASNLRRLYHEGIQPFIYLTVAQACGIPLKGTLMFIANAKECVVETVMATPEQLKQANRYMLETLTKVIEVEKRGTYCRNRTQCITLTSECPYRALCLEHAAPSYVEEASQLMYEVEDPLGHYGEQS